jgi:hypothetical protein
MAANQATRFYEIQIEPQTDENFSYAYVQCWLPPSTPQIKGILCVVLHPHENRNVRFDNPQPWIEFAGQYGCAVLGVSFVEKDGDLVPWCAAGKGSGRALLDAVDELARQSSTPALSQALLTMAGICEAGQFAYEFAAWQPKRVRAFFTMGGGKHEVSLAQAAARVPGLLIAAPDRGQAATDNVSALFAAGRRHNALWIFAEEPVANYDRGECSRLAADFLSTALEALGSSSSAATVSVLVSKEPSAPDERRLSFVSKPLPKLGTILPQTLAMGVVDQEGMQKDCDVEFEVEAEKNIPAENIRILTNPEELTQKITPLGKGKWHVSCSLNPKKIPCGPFRIDVPVRFVDRDNQPIYGGISGMLTGRMTGDILINPIALNIGLIKGNTTKETRLVLKSRSDSKISIGEISSSFPEWVKCETIADHGTTIELVCRFTPPPNLRNKSFSSYLWIRVKSKYEQRIKVLFYGAVE